MQWSFPHLNFGTQHRCEKYTDHLLKFSLDANPQKKAMTEKELLESILAADVLILSHLIEAKKFAWNVHSKNADFTADAIRKIKTSKQDLISRLISN